jgi:hypothetical protein
MKLVSENGTGCVLLLILSSSALPQVIDDADRVSRGACPVTVKVVDGSGSERPYQLESFVYEEHGRSVDLRTRATGMTIHDLSCTGYEIRLAPMDRSPRGTRGCRDAATRSRISLSGGPRHALKVVQAREDCSYRGDRGPQPLKFVLHNLPQNKRAAWCSLSPTLDNRAVVDDS